MVLGSATVIYCVLIVRFELPVPVVLFAYLGGIRGLSPGSVCIFRALLWPY